MAPKAPDGDENMRCHSIWTNNYRLFSYFYTFGYFFVFVVLVSIMEDYLSVEDHILPAQF